MKSAEKENNQKAHAALVLSVTEDLPHYEWLSNPQGSAAPPRDGSGRLPWALEWAGEVGNGKKTKYHPMLGVERVGKGLGMNC
jgi:hypothetical protein